MTKKESTINPMLEEILLGPVYGIYGAQIEESFEGLKKSVDFHSRITKARGMILDKILDYHFQRSTYVPKNLLQKLLFGTYKSKKVKIRSSFEKFLNSHFHPEILYEEDIASELDTALIDVYDGAKNKMIEKKYFDFEEPNTKNFDMDKVKSFMEVLSTSVDELFYSIEVAGHHTYNMLGTQMSNPFSGWFWRNKLKSLFGGDRLTEFETFRNQLSYLKGQLTGHIKNTIRNTGFEYNGAEDKEKIHQRYVERMHKLEKKSHIHHEKREFTHKIYLSSCNRGKYEIERKNPKTPFQIGQDVEKLGTPSEKYRHRMELASQTGNIYDGLKNSFLAKVSYWRDLYHSNIRVNVKE